MKRYYLDTSIWLDFLEDRNEPDLPKSDWATELIKKIIGENGQIIYSDLIVAELAVSNYTRAEINVFFNKLRPILRYVEPHARLLGKAKDLAKKRYIPKGDALHALIAREEKAILVTLDHHFKQLADICKPRKPTDII